MRPDSRAKLVSCSATVAPGGFTNNVLRDLGPGLDLFKPFANVDNHQRARLRHGAKLPNDEGGSARAPEGSIS